MRQAAFVSTGARSILLFLAAFFAGCEPYPTAPADELPAPAMALLPGSFGNLSLLHSQTPAPLSGTSCAASIQPCQLADDFSVPSGETWKVTHAVLTVSRLSVPNPIPPNELALFIYEDLAGAPAALFANPTASVISVTHSPFFPLGDVWDIVVVLPTRLQFTAGTYWLGLQMVDAIGPLAWWGGEFPTRPGGRTWRFALGQWLQSVNDRALIFELYTQTPTNLLADLRAAVQGLGLDHGIANALDAKLHAAQEALKAGDTAGTCSALQDFINQLVALSGKKVPAPDANGLIDAAVGILADLGC